MKRVKLKIHTVSLPSNLKYSSIFTSTSVMQTNTQPALMPNITLFVLVQ